MIGEVKEAISLSQNHFVQGRTFMSSVTFAQETLVVLTELSDEEINGVVGGGYKKTTIGSPDVNIKTKGDVVVVSQYGNADSKGKGDATVKQTSVVTIDKSKTKVIF